MFQSIYNQVDKVSVFIIRLGGALILLSAVVVTFDVITRRLFGYSIAGADEISGYLFAIATAAAFSSTLLRLGNIRIDAAYRTFPLKVRISADFLAISVLTGFLGLVTWMSSIMVMDSFTNWSRSITPLQTPLFLPQIFWLIFLAFAVFSGCIVILASLEALLKRDFTRVTKMIGVLTLEDEIEAESGHLTDAVSDADTKSGS